MGRALRGAGDVSPKPLGGDRRSGRVEAHRGYLLGLARRTPDITLLEIQERVVAHCGERFSVSVLWRFFDRHEITFKKIRACIGATTPRRPGERRRWFDGQLDLDPAKLVFIDETGASTNLARKRGRCRRGRRLRAGFPHGHYKTITLVAALRLRGVSATKVFDRPITAQLFEQWVEKCFVPTLGRGDIVVMDNLRCHKGDRVEERIKAVGAEVRYLPPYSPDHESDREGLLEAESFLAQNRRAHHRRSHPSSPNLRGHFQTRRMPKLLLGLRI